MCRPVKLQSWSTNKAIRGISMFELRSGYPSYRGLKLFFASMLPIFLFLSFQEYFISNGWSYCIVTATHLTAASSFTFSLLSRCWVTSIHWGFKWWRVVMQRSSPMSGMSSFREHSGKPIGFRHSN